MYSDNRKYYCFHMQQTNQSTKRVRLKRKSKDDNNLVDAYHGNNKETLIIRVGTTVSIDRLNDWCDIIVKKNKKYRFFSIF